MWKDVSQILVAILIVIAAIVAGGLMLSRNMWAWIIAYWIVLLLKNAADLCAARKERRYGKDHR